MTLLHHSFSMSTSTFISLRSRMCQGMYSDIEFSIYGKINGSSYLINNKFIDFFFISTHGRTNGQVLESQL